jgi:hypothetical protein
MSSERSKRRFPAHGSRPKFSRRVQRFRSRVCLLEPGGSDAEWVSRLERM